MFCGGSGSVSVNTQARRLKDGKILRYKDGFFGGKWKLCYAVLYEDSTFAWYDEESDTKPLGSIILKNHIPYFAVGQMTDRLPVTRPALPSGTSVHHVIAIGTGVKAEKVYWFLFRSDSELASWMGEVVKTFPPPPQPPAGQLPMPNAPYPSQQPLAPIQGASYPPAQPQQPYPAYPPGPRSMPQQQLQQAPNTTVVVQQTPSYGGGYGYGGGSGVGFGEGMLIGGLMGYGLGSHWGGGYGYGGYGFGGGWGGGYGGYGGGEFIQDNDTTVVNNYYGDNNGGGGGGYDQGNQQQQDYSGGNNDYTGGNDGGYDNGGGYDDGGGYDNGGGYDDGGGFDGGGGDFGGGDY